MVLGQSDITRSNNLEIIFLRNLNRDSFIYISFFDLEISVSSFYLLIKRCIS